MRIEAPAYTPGLSRCLEPLLPDGATIGQGGEGFRLSPTAITEKSIGRVWGAAVPSRYRV